MKKTTVPAQFQMEYNFIERPHATETFLILHGFYESAQIIEDKILPILPDDANILIPNGCFPLPKRRSKGWDLYFSWYFFDEATQSFYVDYEFPAHCLTELLKKLDLQDSPLTIIGYSQGGYLSPFVAEKNNNCHRVIGLGCSYKFERLQKSSHYKVYGIHGDQDDKVDPINAQKCFEKLEPLGIKGTFSLLKGLGHDLNEEYLSNLKQILK